jgi:hypothetical protein
MNDAQRAAVIATITSTLNALVLAGLVDISAEALGGINLAIGNFVLLLALVFPSKPAQVQLVTAAGDATQHAVTPPVPPAP